MDWIARFAEYARHCMAQPLGFPDCNQFWGGSFLVAIIVVGIAAIKLIYRSYGTWRDEQRAVEEIIEGKRSASPDLAEQFPRRRPGSLGVDVRRGDLVGTIEEEAAKRKDALQ